MAGILITTFLGVTLITNSQAMSLQKAIENNQKINSGTISMETKFSTDAEDEIISLGTISSEVEGNFERVGEDGVKFDGELNLGH